MSNPIQPTIDNLLELSKQVGKHEEFRSLSVAIQVKEGRILGTTVFLYDGTHGASQATFEDAVKELTSVKAQLETKLAAAKFEVERLEKKILELQA